jgi:hypothetical protein
VIEYMFELDDARNRRLLRFGTDDPMCEDCGLTEVDSLCIITKPGRTSESIVCRNCKDSAKPITAKALKGKARRFEEAGYFEPACVVCHEPNLQILELDHLVNRANGDIELPLCGNHHAIKSQSAEVGPMATLRLADPNRRALVLQAIFEFGGASIIGMIAYWDGQEGQGSRAVFLGVLAAGLLLWALWNLRADAHLASVYGERYDYGLPPAPSIPLASAMRDVSGRRDV